MPKLIVWKKEYNNTFSRLEYYSGKGYEVTLSSGFTPLSTEFAVKENDRLNLYGGFIYHGPHDGFGSGRAPTFSVSLEKTHGWSIHT